MFGLCMTSTEGGQRGASRIPSNVFTEILIFLLFCHLLSWLFIKGRHGVTGTGNGQ